jgi:hypothetical protein
MSELDALPKCPRCSRPVRDNHRVVLRHGELLHEYCDLLRGSEARVRTTRKVIARTWDAIQRSVRSLGRGALVLLIEPNPTVARELKVCVEGAGLRSRDDSQRPGSPGDHPFVATRPRVARSGAARRSAR